jgi:hypothetical protein
MAGEDSTFHRAAGTRPRLATRNPELGIALYFAGGASF